MGKRSNFQRVDKDFYRTPYEAVVPLLPHIKNIKYFIEPCAGDGILVKHLAIGGNLKSLATTDIDPRLWVSEKNALSWTKDEVFEKRYLDYEEEKLVKPDAFITNPPWSRDILHPLIEHLSNLLPTWLLFDADWMHTRQSSELLRHCQSIVSVGRVRWFPETKMTGKDNCAWYLFDKKYVYTPKFYGREPKINK